MKDYFQAVNIKVITNILVLFASIMVWNARADNCMLDTAGTHNLNLGNYIVQRDAPVGSDITSTSPNFGNTGHLWAVANDYCYMNLVITYNGAVPAGITDVYKTNLEGVGIKLGASDTLSYYWGSPAPGKVMHNGSAYYIGGTGIYPAYIALVKTGPITSGQLTSGEVGYETVYGIDQTTYPGQSFTISNGSVTQVACSIKTPNLTFPIGDVLATKFGTSVGTLPDGGENTQNLGLDCDAGANINVSLNGTQNPDLSDNSILALTGQGDAGVASGVGVQLLYNDAPLKLNNRIVLKKSDGGQETFPIKARYYQTKTAVTTGTANASATLELTYQ